VKALRGRAHDWVATEPWGLAGDRRWMIVDSAGTFVTQRKFPVIARIAAANGPDGLVLSTGGEQLAVPLPGPDAATLEVRVWRDTIRAACGGAAASSWLSAAIGIECRLVYLADPRLRPVNPAYGGPGEWVNLADGFPVLLVSLASLADLNSRLLAPVPIGRFRPNIVVQGCEAWAEDRWRRVRIGPVIFRVGKACERCTVTTIDPETGERPDKLEPLRTLARFRRDVSGHIMFGQNLIPETTGWIAMNDCIEVLEQGASNVSFAAAGDVAAE
jgi:uncharacterized protein YcbX